jgi:uncharacterized protein
MRYSLPVYFMFLLVQSATAQIKIVDPPKAGYEKRIKSLVDEIRIIDTHEHLTSEEKRIKSAGKLDFTSLFRHYAKEDLISASNNKGLVELIYNSDFSLEDRWQILEPLYKAMGSTGYGRVPLIAARDLYGVSEINASTIELLSKKIRQASKKGLYNDILKERAKIDVSIQDMGHQKFNPNYYRHVERFDQYAMVSSISEIKDMGKLHNLSVNSLLDYQKVLRKVFLRGFDSDMVGVKIALAYKRNLKFENVSKERAERIFSKLTTNSPVDAEETKALQDYLLHRILDLVDEFDLPVQIHTGLHAGNGNDITNSKPTHLVNLFMEYPGIDFLLFHGGYPYGGELGTLAKNFPNVYIDMCWTYVISPSYSERYLHEWIETIPANKILGFGGDYSFVEAVYAHSVMARQIITKVLTAKVRDQYLTEKEASNIARMILRENAMRVFKLDGNTGIFDGVEALTKEGAIRDWWEIHKSDKGFIRNWKVIGPFDLGTGLDHRYPPEIGLNLNKALEGKGGTVRWNTENTTASGYLNLIAVFGKQNPDINPRSEGIAYAYTEVVSPDARDVKITLGSNDGAKMWINDDVVYNVHAGRNAVADHEILKVKFKKGKNKILVKVENLGASWGLYLRIIDPENELKIQRFN